MIAQIPFDHMLHSKPILIIKAHLKLTCQQLVYSLFDLWGPR